MISKLAANKMLDFILNESYVGLLKADETEINATGYNRKRIFFKNSAEGETLNTNSIDYGIALNDLGLVEKIGIYDSAGNLLMIKTLDYKKEIRMSDNYFIPASAIVIRFEDLR